MNNMDRTVQQASFYKGFDCSKVDMTHEVEALDLYLLPVETNFVMKWLMKDPIKKTSYKVPTDANMMMSGKMAGINSVKCTLRTAQMNMVDGRPNVCVAMQKDRNPKLKVHSYVQRDGACEMVGRWLKSGVVTNGIAASAAEKLSGVSLDNLFVDQSTIKFPVRLVNRPHVTFLGLPKDTIVPTNNGGMFSVVRRMGVELHKNGAVKQGTLVLKPLNAQATEAAERAGWAKDGTYFCAPGNLFIDNDRIRVRHEDIQVPNASPVSRLSPTFVKAGIEIYHEGGGVVDPTAEVVTLAKVGFKPEISKTDFNRWMFGS